MGEFDSRIYLPSVPQLMQEYGISKSTASNAIALLSDIGFVRILDKRNRTPEGGTPCLLYGWMRKK